MRNRLLKGASMPIVLLTVLGGAAGTGIAVKQGKLACGGMGMGFGHMKGMHGEAKAKVQEQIGLTDEQKAQMEQLRESMKTQMEALRNEKLTMDEHRQRAREMAQQARERMDSVLTDEQRAKIEAMKQEARSQHLDKMSEHLSLSAEQRTEVEKMMQEQRARFEALRNSNDFSQMREDAKKLRDEFKKQLESILTPEQVERLGQMRGRHRGHGPSNAEPPAKQTVFSA